MRTQGNLQKTLVIIPTYNEAKNIQPLISQILELADSPDVLVIDDNSPDATADIVEQQFSPDAQVHLLRRQNKLGLGTAYTAGFRYGLERGYSALITMDADFSHNPLVIPQMKTAASNHDLVIGSRYIAGGSTVHWGIFRKLISRTANIVANNFLSLSPRDCTSGFRLYRAEALWQLDFESIPSDGYSYLVEILVRASHCNLKIAEIPIQFVDRQYGRSKISRKEIFKAIQTVLRLGFRAGS